jgi:acyl-CoA synthetase (AMP-forming)/AMP-acid ligase II
MNIGHFLTAAARRHPEHPAIICGDRVLSYRQFDERVNALAAGLVDLGLRPGERVAVLMWNQPEMIEAYFAIWKAGACVVPLNARFVSDELLYHVDDSRCFAVMYGQEFETMVADNRRRMAAAKYFIGVGPGQLGQLQYEELVEKNLGARAPDVHVDESDLAWLFYTSGTTGRPKGAMLTHGNLSFMAVGWVADLMPLDFQDIGLHAAPLSHGAGFHAIALVLKGATQVIPSPHNFRPESFCETVQRFRITNTWLVPTQIKLLLNYPELEKWDLSSLKWIVYGGAPMYVEDLKEALARIGPVFVQIYGQGETPMTGTYLPQWDHILEGRGAERLASCGFARSGLELRIVDDSDNVLSHGKIGELCVSGPSVMTGYWERPEATSETLRGGWLHTGDIGRMDEQGYVYLLDRSKDLVISGGANIYPREVEEVLLQHPAVSEACVFGVPDPIWGESLKAVIVLQENSTVVPTEISEFAAAHLAGYKKPKSIDIVRDLPKNAYGKVLKRELRAPYWDGQDRMVR